MNLMNLGRTENSKQAEFLNDIRDIGMSIVFGECDADVFSATFEEYLDYVEKPSEYLQTIKKVYNMIHSNECTPDDLLLIMGKYTKTIEYEEPEIEFEIPVDEFDEFDLTEDEFDEEYGCCSLDAKTVLRILSKLYEE